MSLTLPALCFLLSALPQGRAEASVYSSKYHGRKTASGERYDHHQKGPLFTVATARRRGSLRPAYPFGTRLTLTAANGRKVQVRVTDTGSYRPRRASAWFDLPPAAWQALYPNAKPGRALVRFQVIQP